MDDDNANVQKLFQVCLEEYKTLRAEILMRVQTQNQTFGFLLVVIGAAITAIVGTANAAGGPERLPVVVVAVLLFLPLMTCPLGFLFFDNEILINAAGSYIYYDTRKHLARMTQESRVLGSILEFSYLPAGTPQLFESLSHNRWLLFMTTSIAPVVLCPLYLAGTGAYVAAHLLPFTFLSSLYVAMCGLLYLFDIALCVRLYRAMRWVPRNRQHQKARYARDLPSSATDHN